MKRAILLLALAALASAPALFGAATALDNAAQSAYSDGWQTGDNGGSGFGNWTLSSGSNSGFFVGTSQPNGFNDGNIDTAGVSWGLYANNNDTAGAVRTFTAGGYNGLANLAAGETFSLRIDTGFIDGTVGFSLQNSNGDNRFEFYFVGGSQNYTVNVGGTQIDTGVKYSTAGMLVQFAQQEANAWTLTITGTAGPVVLTSGTVGLAASDISQVRLFNYNAGSGTGHDQFFNQMSIVPEPSTVFFLVSASAVLVVRRRRL